MDPSEGPDYALRCHPGRGFALVQLRGEVRGDDIVAVGRAIAHHPDWQPGFTEVWDMRATTMVDVVPSDLGRFQALESELADRLEGTTTLVLIDRPMLRYALQFYARMVKPFGREVVVVETDAEAAAVLGIESLPSPESGGGAALG